MRETAADNRRALAAFLEDIKPCLYIRLYLDASSCQGVELLFAYA